MRRRERRGSISTRTADLLTSESRAWLVGTRRAKRQKVSRGAQLRPVRSLVCILRSGDWTGALSLTSSDVTAWPEWVGGLVKRVSLRTLLTALTWRLLAEVLELGVLAVALTAVVSPGHGTYNIRLFV